VCAPCRKWADARVCPYGSNVIPTHLKRYVPILLALVAGFWFALGTAMAAPPAESFRLVPGVNSLFGMETGYIWLSGSALIPAGGRPGSGTLVNISDQLGVDQGEATVAILKSVILRSHVLNLDVLMFSPNAVRKVRNAFVFHNKTYEEGTSVETKLDFTWIRLGYGYRVPVLSGLTVAPGMGVHYIRHGITLNAETKRSEFVSNSRQLDGTYPVIGLETRYQFPLGFDLSLELEGIHLVTRGYLILSAFTVSWQAHPDVVLSLGCSDRTVRYLETHQPLNNEWSYNMLGFTAGIAFTF